MRDPALAMAWIAIASGAVGILIVLAKMAVDGLFAWITKADLDDDDWED